MTGLPPPSEHDEQTALFTWAALNEWHEPRLALLFAIPNGGHRSKATAGKLKAEGVKAGVPDVFLPAYHLGREQFGLFVELKRVRGGATSPEQRAWHDRLRRNGYRVEVCKGWTAAAIAICDHLGRADMAPTQ